MSERRAGRPTILNRRIHRVVTEAMRAGNYLETAAALAGVDPSTLRRWIARGERERRRRDAGETPDSSENGFVRFAQDVGRAAAAAQSEIVGRIVRAGREDWRAAAWWLERRHGDGWGHRVDEQAVNREVETFLDRVESKLEPSAFEHILQIVAGDE